MSCICSCLNESRTSWSDRPHQPVHLDVPVFDVGARLAKFPLSSLPDTDSGTVKIPTGHKSLPVV